jgi:hypothetical protein
MSKYYKKPRIVGQPVKKSLVWTSHQLDSLSTKTLGNTLTTSINGAGIPGVQWCFVVDEATEAGTYGSPIIKIKAVPFGGPSTGVPLTFVAYRLLAIPKGESVQSVGVSLSNNVSDSVIAFGDINKTTGTKCKGLNDLYPTPDTVLWSSGNGIVQFDAKAPSAYYVEDHLTTKRKMKKQGRIVLVLAQTNSDVQIAYTAEIITYQKTN